MTREEALNLLRGGPDGIKEWNTRLADNEPAPSLADAHLGGANLAGANLAYVDLRGATFAKSDLTAAHLTFAQLSGADLTETNLSDAVLDHAVLDGADLTNANLTRACLVGAILDGATVAGANLHEAEIGATALPFDLSQVCGLDEVVHLARSFITIDALRSFKDDLPEKFLRGCGLDDQTITYFRSRIAHPIRFYTCFISYSTQDDPFATRLHNDFQAAGIRCWKWDHDARTGRSLWGEIDQAIRHYDKLVLIASEHSLKSPAVNREIERALQQEDQRLKQKQQGQDTDPDVLFPIRLDDYVFNTWDHERKPDVVKKVIADARGWETDHATYQKVLQKLIQDLKPTP